MTERVQEPGSDDPTGDTTAETTADTTAETGDEGPKEILDAAADELAIPADESNEG